MRVFQRGITEVEVACVKRLRQLGFARDYIFGFLAQPGRVLTPAVVNEIWICRIGPDIEAASDEVLIEFVAASSRNREQDFDSAWAINRALVWTLDGSRAELFREGYETEYKIMFEDGEEKVAVYMKTMAALANGGGGYLFFGIADNGVVTGIDPDKFSGFDWDGFDKRLESYFSPYFKWAKRTITQPTLTEMGFDLRLVLKIMKSSGLDRDVLEQISAATRESAASKTLGVISVAPASLPIRCRKPHSKSLKDGAFYVRRHGRNSTGEPEDIKLNLANIKKNRSLKPPKPSGFNLSPVEQVKLKISSIENSDSNPLEQMSLKI
jgi:Putative DNA-binding domain